MFRFQQSVAALPAWASSTTRGSTWRATPRSAASRQPVARAYHQGCDSNARAPKRSAKADPHCDVAELRARVAREVLELQRILEQIEHLGHALAPVVERELCSQRRSASDGETGQQTVAALTVRAIDRANVPCPHDQC